MSDTTPTPPHPACLPAADLRWQDGQPVSAAYGDFYFSRRDGVAESVGVFLDGNDLPRGWHGRSRFTVAELGFGSGLNFALTRQRFLQTTAPDAQLEFISFEAHPLATADQRRLAIAIGARAPGLGAFLQQWADRLPPRIGGWHQRSFDGGRVRLSLYYGDVAEGLQDWRSQRASARADAWFLDGFAPSQNPAMWRPELFHELAALSRPGATVASFSVARSVREGLEAAGFSLQRVPGPVGKREVLRGRLQGPVSPEPAQARRVAVLGAGLAGACTARACAERGLEVDLYDPAGAASQASANPWAVLHPRLPLDDGPRGPWLARAWHFSLAWLENRPGWRPHKVVQLPEARRPERLRRVLQRYRVSGDWLQPHALGDLDCLAFAGGHADLPRLVASLLQPPRIRFHNSAVTSLDPAWLASHDAVVLATGSGTALLPAWLPLQRMRGQLDRTRTPQPLPATVPILTGRGHAVPLTDGWVAGASYQRDGAPGPATAAETTANLERLQQLRGWLESGGYGPLEGGTPLTSFVGVRAHLPDRLPVLGQLGDSKIWLNCGHGSSGLLSCPLSGAWLAACLARGAPVLDRTTQAALTPMRHAANNP